jgi:hypothetical protein
LIPADLGIDSLTIEDGLITEIRVVAHEVTRLMQLEALGNLA